MQSSTPIRLNKFLAERIGVSRRQADDLITRGCVTVNGKPAQIGQPIDKNDKVCYNRKDIPFFAKYTYLILNKPPGYVSSRRQQGDTPTLYSLLPKKYHALKTAGRLDQDTSGLILLTNDGDFAFQMTHPSFYKEKQYLVQLDRPLAPLHQQMVADFGINLPDGVSKLQLLQMEAEELVNFPLWQVDCSGGAADKTNHDGRKLHDVHASAGWKRRLYDSKNTRILTAEAKNELYNKSRDESASVAENLYSKFHGANVSTKDISPEYLYGKSRGASASTTENLYSKTERYIKEGADLKILEKIYADAPRRFWVVTMHEGRNRQIRRTFGALGYTVERLHRVRFGGYLLGELGVGEFEETDRF